MAPATYTMGTYLGDVALADFNADGHIDMAMVNRMRSTIAIRMGVPGGMFGAETLLDTGVTTQGDIAHGDFDGDGNVDLLLAGNNTVNMLRGKGDGTFTFVIGPVVYQNPRNFTTGDFNNDGKLDVAATATSAGGSFATMVQQPGGLHAAFNHTIVTKASTSVFDPRGITSGDFDHDGFRDIAVSIAYGEYPSQITHTNVYVFYGLGDGYRFTAAAAPLGVDPAALGPPIPDALTAVDLNGDGRDDLAVAYRESSGNADGTRLGVFISGPDRTFASEVKYGENALSQMWTVRAADMDGDGNSDVVVASTWGVKLFKGNGDGTLRPPSTPWAAIYLLGLGIADLDRDGGPDLVTTNLTADGNNRFTGYAHVLMNWCGNAGLTLSSSANPADEGRDFELTASVQPRAGLTPTGTLTIKYGDSVIASGPLTGTFRVSATIRDFVPGTYQFTASYSGDSRFPASMRTLAQTVRTPSFGPPPRLNAVSNGGEVSVSWLATTGTDHYEIWRNGGAGWSLLGVSGVAQYRDAEVLSNAAYLYKVRAINTAGTASAFSDADLALTIPFQDDPVVAGTPMRLAHLTQLRTAVDLARNVLGVAPQPWTDTVPALIRVAHWTELRTAISALRAQLLLRPATYTDSLLAGTTPIRAIHVNQLREAIR